MEILLLPFFGVCARVKRGLCVCTVIFPPYLCFVRTVADGFWIVWFSNFFFDSFFGGGGGFFGSYVSFFVFYFFFCEMLC